MIFAKADHIQQIIAGTKTQTRRPTDRYKVGRTYAIQPGRGKPGIPDGRILITEKRIEMRLFSTRFGFKPFEMISPEDAEAEGGYTPGEYEALYEKMYPGWAHRWAYTFKFIPAEENR